MKKFSKNNVKKTITSMLELPKEIVFNLPLMTVIGNEEINIENYKGIIEYDFEQVRISTSSGVIKINGKNLRLKQITAESISILGTIVKLEYLL